MTVNEKRVMASGKEVKAFLMYEVARVPRIDGKSFRSSLKRYSAPMGKRVPKLFNSRTCNKLRDQTIARSKTVAFLIAMTCRCSVLGYMVNHLSKPNPEIVVSGVELR